MKRNVGALVLTAGALLVAPPGVIHAETLQEKMQQVQTQQGQTAQQLQSKQQEKSLAEQNAEEIEQKLDDLQKQEQTLLKEMDQNKQQLAKLQEEITTLQAQIEETKKRIEARKQIVNGRLTAMQETQGDSPLGIWGFLLDSKSLADMIERAVVASELVQADQHLLDLQKQDMNMLEQKEGEVKNASEDLAKRQAELKQQEDALQKTKAEQSQYAEEYRKKEQEAQDEMANLAQQQDILKAQEAAIATEMQQEAQRIEEEKRKAAEQAKLEEEARAQAQAQAQTQTAAQPASIPPAPAAETHTAASSGTHGIFIKPAPGVFTTGFEMRWGVMHYGVDIAQAGIVPISAAADGTVISSYLSSSYGNVVMISHLIDGQVFTTVYAHMRNRAVSVGDHVKQGQFLGNMGSTGESTGQHLHFEVHRGPWNFQKTNAVDPMKYL